MQFLVLVFITLAFYFDVF